MRAVIAKGVREIVVEDVPDPRPQQGEVLVAVHAGGICGSDLHTYTGHHPFRKPPVTLGHEICGEIVELGRGVSGWSVGAYVAVEPQAPCLSCDMCHRGFANICRDNRVPGAGLPGMFSEYVALPASCLLRLAENIPPDIGTLIEPLAVAYRAYRQAPMSVGDSVAVLGAGAIGALLSAVCSLARPSALMVSDVKDHNLSVVGALTGCHTVNAASENVVERGMEITSGRGFDAVYVTSGAPDSLAEAVELAKPSGWIVVIALYGDDVVLNANRIVLGERRVVGSVRYTRRDMEASMDIVNRGVIDLKSIVTCRTTLETAPEMFRRLASGLDHVKVVIQVAPESKIHPNSTSIVDPTAGGLT